MSQGQLGIAAVRAVALSRLAPSNPEPYVLLAQIHLRQQDYQGAAEFAGEAQARVTDKGSPVAAELSVLTQFIVHHAFVQRVAAGDQAAASGNQAEAAQQYDGAYQADGSQGAIGLKSAGAYLAVSDFASALRLAQQVQQSSDAADRSAATSLLREIKTRAAMAEPGMWVGLNQSYNNNNSVGEAEPRSLTRQWAASAGVLSRIDQPRAVAMGYDIIYNGATAIDPGDGHTLWTSPAQARYGAKYDAVGPDGTLYVSGSQTLYAVDPNNPSTTKWTLAVSGTLGPPVIGADGNIYVQDGANLYAVSRSGGKLWAYETDSGTAPTAPVNPGGGAQVVYVANRSGIVAIQDGKPLPGFSGTYSTAVNYSRRGGYTYNWFPGKETDNGNEVLGTIAADGRGNLYAGMFARGDSRYANLTGLFKVSPLTGAVEWTYPAGAYTANAETRFPAAITTPPAASAYGAAIAIGTKDGSVTFVDGGGNLLGQAQCDAGDYPLLMALDGTNTAYFADSTGKLYVASDKNQRYSLYQNVGPDGRILPISELAFQPSGVVCLCGTDPFGTFVTTLAGARPL